jgi:uncharacterized membrane protein YphA (DoxX/SURF4 family)
MPYSRARWGAAGAQPIRTDPAKEHTMNAMKISGIILIVLGLAGFFTGGFSFMQESTKAQIGPIQLNVKEKKEVGIPEWLSIGAVVLGGVLLVMGFRKA